VDPSIKSLNQFTDNIGKAEALSIEIASILQESEQSTKGLISKDESPWLPSKTARAKSTVPKNASRRKRGAKPRKGGSPRHKADIGGGVKQKAEDQSPQLLPVSPTLFSRYNREEIYEKLWKEPFKDVAREYGLTYFTLRKICERLWIPVPGRSYLARKAANEPVVPQPPLPKVQVQRREKATGTKS
jgi:hypothetical protein